MDKAAERNFKTTLVKNLQFLCTGYVPFQSNIEIIGHIFMRVDNAKKYNYILEENIAKTELHGTLLSSKTFSAKPDPSDMSISNIHSGFKDEQINPNPTSDTNLPSPDQGGQNKFTPVPLPVSVQVPLPGLLSLPGPAQGSMSEWTPTVKIQSVTSLAPGAHQGHNSFSAPVSEINNQVTKSGTCNNIFHGTGNFQEQTHQMKISSDNSSQSASDILKAISIKMEPKEVVESQFQSPHTHVPLHTSVPSHTTVLSPITVPALSSTNQPGQKQKRKTSHATRMELEPFINKESEQEKKKPRIIKARSILKKPKPIVSDIDEGSQSSSGDFVDVPVHFGDLTPVSTAEEDEVFPVSMLKNLSGFEEACNQSVAFLSQNQAMKTAFQDPRKRGTYNFYTQIEKEKAIDLAAQFGVSAICQRFGIPSSTLWTWKKTYQRNQNHESQSQNVDEPETTDDKTDIKKANLRQLLTENNPGEVTTPSLVLASGRKQRITVKKEPYSP